MRVARHGVWERPKVVTTSCSPERICRAGCEEGLSAWSTLNFGEDEVLREVEEDGEGEGKEAEIRRMGSWIPTGKPATGKRGSGTSCFLLLFWLEYRSMIFESKSVRESGVPGGDRYVMGVCRNFCYDRNM